MIFDGLSWILGSVPLSSAHVKITAKPGQCLDSMAVNIPALALQRLA
jgi:hypothetical protein